MDVTTTENKSNIVTAILAVMDEVKGIDKNMTIGTGKSAYKGIADKEVKQIIGKSMQKNGLCILPTGIEKETTIHTYDEVDQWSTTNPKEIKRKQSVFTEVITEYLLCHTSGESIVLKGLGQGIDPQDKGAGKATTYALKNTLLYTFLVPTGTIDDTDNTHSDDIKTPPAQKPVPPAPKPPKTLDEASTKTVLASDLKGLNATIAGITNKKVLATAEQILQIQNKIIELTPLEPEIPWITTDQINKALESPLKQLKSTINVIKKGKLKAREADLKLLEDKVTELETAV